MGSITLRDNTVLTDYGKPYIVAEVNTSHFGKIELARAMIHKAKEIGCDCVKFQSWSENSLYSKQYYSENPIARRFVKKFSFAEETLLELAAYCKEIGIGFASTPYSRQEVSVLVDKCQVPFIKIASMELNNLPYLEFIARTGVPIVLSTGMGDQQEIERAVETIHQAGNDSICILHCVSIYPVDSEYLNLKNITGLRQSFPQYAVGYSDHSLGTEMATAAIALGACLIEKHFTLDKTSIGMDNQMATEPDEMACLIKQCHQVHDALGSEQRIVSDAEIEQRSKMRRSLVVTQDLTAGTVISEQHLDAKRPGTGFPPDQLTLVLGKTLVQDISADELLLPEHFGDEHGDN